jgi:hypothetical protein
MARWRYLSPGTARANIAKDWLCAFTPQHLKSGGYGLCVRRDNEKLRGCADTSICLLLGINLRV